MEVKVNLRSFMQHDTSGKPDECSEQAGIELYSKPDFMHPDRDVGENTHPQMHLTHPLLGVPSIKNCLQENHAQSRSFM